MTAFDEVLGSLRVERSLYAQFRLHAPWGVRFSTGAQARLVVVAQGRCWLRWEGNPHPLPVGGGSCLIIKPGVTFELSDAQGRPIVACETLLPTHDGRIVEYGGEGELAVLVAGRFSFDPIAAEPLIAHLPALVHVLLEPAHAELLQAGGRYAELFELQAAGYR